MESDEYFHPHIWTMSRWCQCIVAGQGWCQCSYLGSVANAVTIYASHRLTALSVQETILRPVTSIQPPHSHSILHSSSSRGEICLEKLSCCLFSPCRNSEVCKAADLVFTVTMRWTMLLLMLSSSLLIESSCVSPGPVRYLLCYYRDVA